MNELSLEEDSLTETATTEFYEPPFKAFCCADNENVMIEAYTLKELSKELNKISKEIIIYSITKYNIDL